MKRKIISTLLCVSMCAALIMGCGQSDKSDTKETKKKEESKDEEKDETAVFPCGCGRVYDGGSHLAAAGNFGVFYRSRECLESYGVRT